MTASDDAKQKGSEACETLLPFLRTDVPQRAIYAFARKIAKWDAQPGDLAFDYVEGFVDTFWQYQQANAVTALAEKVVQSHG